MKILQLTQSGQPQRWLNRQAAASLYASDRVIWELGSATSTMFGGFDRSGKQSRLDIAPIIACSGELKRKRFVPALSNRLLFRRDDDRCLYCGYQHPYSELTRDHVLPKAQGGLDRWENLVTACRACNHHKGNRTPEQANMPLLAVPFAPNPFEFLFLDNRNILADQMEYLSSSFSSKRNWAA